MALDFDGISQLGGSAAITVVAYVLAQALLRAWAEDRKEAREERLANGERLERIEGKLERLLKLWE